MLRTATIKTISVYSLCFQEVRFQKINRICKFNNFKYTYIITSIDMAPFSCGEQKLIQKYHE